LALELVRAPRKVAADLVADPSEPNTGFE
jgi:hypothetical protein